MVYGIGVEIYFIYKGGGAGSQSFLMEYEILYRIQNKTINQSNDSSVHILLFFIQQSVEIP